MHLPLSLLGHLRDTVQGFVDEEPRDQLSLALMLWTCAEGGRPHKVWPDMFSLSNDDIREIWRDDARMRRVVAFRYLTVHQGSNLSEATNAYAPSIQLAEALVLTCRDQNADDWVDNQLRLWVPSGNAIASMASPAKGGGGNRQTKWKGAKPAKFVPINVVALRSYRDELMTAWTKRPLVEKACEWVRRQVRTIDVALKIAQNTRNPGCFPIKYREGSTGRISAQRHSLQSMPGAVRSAGLVGAWDYDISTCQWTILAQMARRFGIECPLTNAYIADKRSLRRKVSEGAGISLDDAKTCITALLFGAVVQHREEAMRLHPGALVKDIEVPAALRLSKQPDFMALYAEIGRVGGAIVKTWPRNNGRLFNDLRIEYESGSELAHLLQGGGKLRHYVRSSCSSRATSFSACMTVGSPEIALMSTPWLRTFRPRPGIDSLSRSPNLRPPEGTKSNASWTSLRRSPRGNCSSSARLLSLRASTGRGRTPGWTWMELRAIGPKPRCGPRTPIPLSRSWPGWRL